MAVFLDSSVIMGYFTGREDARRIVESGLEFAINDIVYSEVTFGLLRAKYHGARGAYSFYDMKRRLAEGDEVLASSYAIVEDFLRVLEGEARLRFLPVTRRVVETAGDVARALGLLPNDALIAATCRHYGISTIATFDEDFRRVPWLRVVP